MASMDCGHYSEPISSIPAYLLAGRSRAWWAVAGSSVPRGLFVLSAAAVPTPQRLRSQALASVQCIAGQGALRKLQYAVVFIFGAERKTSS